MMLSIFTLNCWGIFGVSKNREARMQAIGEELASGKYDLALLQEVWVKDDFRRMRTIASGVLPYALYFHSGVIGSGLCVLSRYPIVDSFYHQWVVNGYFHKVHHGDWFGGKGVGYCQVVTDEGLRLNVYTAHLHADYDTDHDEYLAHRFLQAFDTSQMVRHTRHNADVTILGGDLNTEPSSGAYKMLIHNGGLVDAFLAANEDRPVYHGCTSETPENSYTPRHLLRRDHRGKRIDYIMYSSSDEYKITADVCETPLPSRVPGESFSFSDHDAVVARLLVSPRQSGEPLAINTTARAKVLRDGVHLCQKALRGLVTDRLVYMQFFILALILAGSLFIFVSMPLWANMLVHSVLGLFSLFFLYMGTIWNMMEKNGIISGLESMEVLLKAVEND